MVKAAVRQEPFSRIPLRGAREPDEVPSAFPTCQIGDHTAAGSGKLVERIDFLAVPHKHVPSLGGAKIATDMNIN